MFDVAAGEDARHRGHEAVGVGDDEAVVGFDAVVFDTGQVGALSDGEDHVIGFERQHPGGVEARIEFAGVVVGPFAELEGERTVVVDAYRAPARVQLHTFGDGVLDLVRTRRHLAALLQGDQIDVLARPVGMR